MKKECKVEIHMSEDLMRKLAVISKKHLLTSFAFLSDNLEQIN